MNINGKWMSEPEVQAYVSKLETKIKKLEEKHYSDENEQSFRQGYNEGYKKGFYSARKSNSLKYPKELQTIADHYGFTSQADMLIEESAEFTQAVNKLRRGDCKAYKNIKEEVADVLVVALQLRLLLGIKDIDSVIYSKVKRQLDRIDNEDQLTEKVKQVIDNDRS